MGMNAFDRLDFIVAFCIALCVPLQPLLSPVAHLSQNTTLNLVPKTSAGLGTITMHPAATEIATISIWHCNLKITFHFEYNQYRRNCHWKRPILRALSAINSYLAYNMLQI